MKLARDRWCLLPAVLVFLVPALSAQDAERFPVELIKFTSLRQQPIFAGAPGQWDALIRERGWIMKDNGVWKLWYTGYVDKKGPMMLGYATSKDGVAWTRHPNNPIYKEH